MLNQLTTEFKKIKERRQKATHTRYNKFRPGYKRQMVRNQTTKIQIQPNTIPQQRSGRKTH